MRYLIICAICLVGCKVQKHRLAVSESSELKTVENVTSDTTKVTLSTRATSLAESGETRQSDVSVITTTADEEIAAEIRPIGVFTLDNGVFTGQAESVVLRKKSQIKTTDQDAVFKDSVYHRVDSELNRMNSETKGTSQAFKEEMAKVNKETIEVEKTRKPNWVAILVSLAVVAVAIWISYKFFI